MSDFSNVSYGLNNRTKDIHLRVRGLAVNDIKDKQVQEQKEESIANGQNEGKKWR